jgi:hypothetical protein
VHTTAVQRPVRVAVFATVDEADRAVRGLLDAGIAVEHISVVCSDEVKESFFIAFEHDRPAGTAVPVTAAAGAVAGLLVGGALAYAQVVLTGGVGLLVVGPLFAGTSAAFGTFVGAMTSRGTEHEVANFYDQALTDGQILVAAEIEDDADAALLDAAERIFVATGAQPISLPQG